VFDVMSECAVTAESLSLNPVIAWHLPQILWQAVLKGGVFLDMSYFWVASLLG